MSDEADQHRRLPVLQVVKASYLMVYSHYPAALKLAVAPLLVAVVPLLLETYAWAGLTLKQGLCAQDICQFVPVLEYGAPLLAIVLTAPMAVAWHRLCDGHDSTGAGRYVIDRQALTYGVIVFVGILLFVAAAFFPLVLFGWYLHNPSLGDLELGILSAIVISVVLATLWHLCLGLPGIALGPNCRARAPWFRPGNVWRLFAGVAISTIPAFLAMVVVSWIFDGSYFFIVAAGTLPTFPSQVVTTVVNAPLWAAWVTLWASAMSFSYRYLVQKEDIVLPGERAT